MATPTEDPKAWCAVTIVPKHTLPRGLNAPHYSSVRHRCFQIILVLLLGLSPIGASGQINGTNWFPIGPADISDGQTYGSGRVNVSGRASAIAVNPMNPNDVWLGTSGGGVWHSTNGGANWLPMSDNEQSLAIGALALDGCTVQGCATVYAGTGENAIRRDTYYGMGLLIGEMSTGEFPAFGWTLRGADKFRFASINNLLLDRTTSGASQVIYVSVSSGQTASATESTVTAPPPPSGYGIYKSLNKGTNWTKLDIPGANGFLPTDLEMDPTDSRTLYAGFTSRGIFKSTDGGTSWCPLNPGISVSGCTAATGLPDPATLTFDHVEIAIRRPSASSPATLYASFGQCPNQVTFNCIPSIFKSIDGGASWTQKLAGAPGTAIDSGPCPKLYSRYTHGLTIHPSDPNTIFLSALRLCRATDTGGTLSFVEVGTSTLHPDHHSLVFPDAANSDRMYETSDGGFASSINGGMTWTSGNSDLQISGFQSISSSPLTARIIGGTQDNGTELWLGTRIWSHRNDGDSGSTILDLDDVMTLFDTKFYLTTPMRSTNGGGLGSWNSISNGITDEPMAFYPPLIQASAPSHAMYFGTNRLYQSTTRGGTWTAISPVLGGTSPIFPDINTSNVITAIAVAPNNGNRIYVGYYDGQIFVTDSACASSGCWTAIGGAARGLPTTVVTRIAVDPNHADTAYATFSGFGAGAHVFKTINRGVSWSAVGSGLPSIPTNTITIENSSTLWVGTDDGVYKSTTSGGNWTRFGNGLPRVPVYEISIDATRGRLYAATHGRGVFILTSPFLSNFEGWVNNDIWDIPVYGNGFVGTLDAPVGSTCTMRIVQRDGSICSSSTTDVTGGTISFDGSGQLVTSRGGFYSGRPVAWACFNGSCIGGRTIAACNPPSNPITSVLVTCGSQVGIDHILGCPAQANPPSTILDISGMPGAGGAGGAGAANLAITPALAAGENMPAPVSFDLIPSVQGRTGTRALCATSVSLQAGDSPLQALLTARDAVNANPGCQSVVSAVVRGTPPEPVRSLEDMLSSPATFSLSAPTVVGGQLFTAVRAAPGAATGVCFGVTNIGSPLQNQIAVMKVEFETAPGGAAGGDLIVVEQSPIGKCQVKIHTDPGETASQIAAAISSAFQAPGGTATCPAVQNPRDVTVEGGAIVSVLASDLHVCNSDRDLGFFIGPKELPNVRRLSLQYAAKFLCGSPETKKHSKDDYNVWPQLMAGGRYFTALNIHNPTDKPAAIRLKVAVALPDGKPGPISRYLEIRLGPDQAISVSCRQILALLQATTPSFIEGFAVVESNVELDVVAVYTASNGGKIETMAIERIPARLQ